MTIEEAVQQVKTELLMHEHGCVKLLAARCEHGILLHKHCNACYDEAIGNS